jgi:O-antigen/teichoic acid export membrane protein
VVLLNAVVAAPVALLRRAPFAREQALVAGAQIASGAGNLAFAVVAARLLAPGAFASLAVFLALYLLVHVPASSLSAGSALSPALAARGRRRALVWGLAAGAALALAAPLLAPLAGVPVGLLLVLAAAVPAAPWLALERGRLYGQARHGRAAASLAAEPAIRLALGIPLCASAGAVGAGLAVVLGGWAALAITRPGLPRRARAETAPDRRAATARGAGLATVAFLALAILQNQDVVLANGVLEPEQAGRFAVLSTIGGLAAFATTTVPLVLLPRSAGGERGALGSALAVAALLGVVAVGAVALVPSQLVGAAFGERYASVGTLAVPYVGAMALFGVVRVLVADRCARGGGRAFAVLLGAVAAAQAAAILVAGDDAGTIVAISVAAMVALAAGAGVLALLLREREREPGPVAAAPAAAPARQAAPARAPRVPTWLLVGGLVAGGLALRVLASRGIWLDEATSIHQAQMPLAQMLDVLRTTDVHPPLHHLVLWAIAHTAGTSELAVRAPSLAAGAATIVVLYLLGNELYDRKAGLLAAALGTVAPFLVWYSQEARMYGLFMLFAALAVYAQVVVLRRGRRRDWALYAGATAALLWTQYFGILLVATQQVGFAAAAWSMRRAGRPLRSFLLPWGAALALVAIALAPLAGLALDQFQNNQAAGRGFNAPSQAGSDVSDLGRDQPGVYVLLTNLVWGVWGYHSSATMAAVTSLWPLGMLAALVLLGRRHEPLSALVLACALVPAIAMFAVGFAKPFLFEIRYFAGAVPLLLVLLARAVTGWARGTAAIAVCAGILLSTLGVAFADQQLNRSNPRMYDFEGALTRIEHEARPGDVVLYEPFYLKDVVRYYAPGLRTAPLSSAIPKRDDTRRVFLMASFLNEPRHARTTGQGLAKLKAAWKPDGDFRRPQVHVWEFGK